MRSLNIDEILLLINLFLKFEYWFMFAWNICNVLWFSKRDFECVSLYLLNTMRTACFCFIKVILISLQRFSRMKYLHNSNRNEYLRNTQFWEYLHWEIDLHNRIKKYFSLFYFQRFSHGHTTVLAWSYNGSFWSWN